MYKIKGFQGQESCIFVIEGLSSMCLLRCFFVFHLVTLCGVQTFHSSAFVCVASTSATQFTHGSMEIYHRSQIKDLLFLYITLPDPSHCLCFWVLFPSHQ